LKHTICYSEMLANFLFVLCVKNLKNWSIKDKKLHFYRKFSRNLISWWWWWWWVGGLVFKFPGSHIVAMFLAKRGVYCTLRTIIVVQETHEAQDDTWNTRSLNSLQISHVGGKKFRLHVHVSRIRNAFSATSDLSFLLLMFCCIELLFCCIELLLLLLLMLWKSWSSVSWKAVASAKSTLFVLVVDQIKIKNTELLNN
jgi:hypothetical protein